MLLVSQRRSIWVLWQFLPPSDDTLSPTLSLILATHASHVFCIPRNQIVPRKTPRLKPERAT